MKKKIPLKKLSLSKEVIATLSRKQSLLLFGGDQGCSAGKKKSCSILQSFNGGDDCPSVVDTGGNG